MTCDTPDINRVVLRLEGGKAARGLSLADLRAFVGHFIGALRGFDRVRRAEPARRAGHPERRSERVAAFRLVEFHTGSAVATLESAAREEQDEALFDDQEDPALDNLGALLDQLRRDEALDAEVLDALDSARRALGEDGRIGLSLPGQNAAFTIDRERVERLRGRPSGDARTVRQVSGRLHLIDLEPGRIGIRTPSGVEWSCRYGEELEETVKKLIDKVVVADGEGRLTSPQRGSMELEGLKPALPHEQTALFSEERVSLDELLKVQDITRPQGLSALGDPEWEDDDESERFLEFVLGRS